MASIKLCEWGIAMNPYATREQIAARLLAHRDKCHGHGEPRKKRRKKAKP